MPTLSTLTNSLMAVSLARLNAIGSHDAARGELNALIGPREALLRAASAVGALRGLPMLFSPLSPQP